MRNDNLHMGGDIGCSLRISCVEGDISNGVCPLGGIQLGSIVVTLVILAFLPSIVEAAGAHRSLSSSSRLLAWLLGLDLALGWCLE